MKENQPVARCALTLISLCCLLFVNNSHGQPVSKIYPIGHKPAPALSLVGKNTLARQANLPYKPKLWQGNGGILNGFNPVPGNTCDTYLYEQQISTPGTDDQVYSVYALTNGDALLAGRSGNNGLLVMQNKQGIKKWATSYMLGAGTLSFKRATVAADGSLILAATYAFALGGDSSIALIKADTAGHILATNLFPVPTGNSSITARDALVLSSGNLAFFGR